MPLWAWRIGWGCVQSVPIMTQNTVDLPLFCPNSLILICHGSRRESWRAPFESFLNRLSTMADPDKIYLCYMEIAEPMLADVAKTMVERGQTNGTVFPLFMASGGHVDHDITAQISDVVALYPSITLTLAGAIGEHPEVLAAMAKIAVAEVR